jgi:hypothetical protein
VGLILCPVLIVLNYLLVGQSIRRLEQLGAGPVSTGVLTSVIVVFAVLGLFLGVVGLGLFLRQRWGRRLGLIAGVACWLVFLVAVCAGFGSMGLASVEIEEHHRYAGGFGPQYIRFDAIVGVPALAPAYGVALLVLLNLPAARNWARRWAPVPVLEPVSADAPLPVVPVRRTSVAAVLSMILAFTPFLLIPQIVSLILGIMALRKIRRSRGALSGRGFAITGVCLSGCILLFFASLGVLVIVILLNQPPPPPDDPFKPSQKAHLTGQLAGIRRLDGHQVRITRLTFSPDGADLLSQDENGNVFLWDVAEGTRKFVVAKAEPGTPQKSEPGDKGLATKVAPLEAVFVRRGQQILIVYPFVFVRIDRVDRLTGKKVGSLALTAAAPYLVGSSRAVAADVEKLAYRKVDDIVLLDLATGQQSTLFTFADDAEGKFQRFSPLALSADGQRLFYRCRNNKDFAEYWVLLQGNPLRTVHRIKDDSGAGEKTEDVVPAPAGNIALTGPLVWDLSQGTRRGTFAGHRWGSRCVALSADGEKALSGGRSPGEANMMVFMGQPRDYGMEVCLWDTQTQKELGCYLAPASVSAVALSPDGRHAAAGTSAGQLMTFQIK